MSRVGNNKIKVENMKKCFLLLILVWSIDSWALYTNRQFIHLHKNPSINSVTLTSLSCATRLKKVKQKESESNFLWQKVSVGSFTGFVKSKFISKKKSKCFSSRYPVIFNSLDFSMIEIYKWGRINDLFVEGITGIK